MTWLVEVSCKRLDVYDEHQIPTKTNAQEHSCEQGTTRSQRWSMVCLHPSQIHECIQQHHHPRTIYSDLGYVYKI